MFKRAKISVIGVLFLIAFFYGSAYGQESQPVAVAPPQAAVQQPVPEAAPQETVNAEEENDNTVTLDFKDADIQNVLRVLAYKSGVNILRGNGYMGV